MRRNSRKAFVLTTLMHCGFAGLLFLGTFKGCVREEEEPIVMTLYTPPTDTPAEPEPAPSPPTPQEAPRPEPEPLYRPTQQTNLPTVPRFQRPEPEPPTPAPPPPQPQAQQQRPVERRPDPPKPQQQSWEDFQRTHGTPTTPAPRPQPQQPRRVEAPRIDVSDIRAEVRSTTSNTQNTRPQATANQLDDYKSRLYAMIDRAWSKPPSAMSGASTTVEFSVAGNGTITGVRIVKSSGDSATDQSVLNAFRQIGNAGATPDRRDYTFRIPFRVD